MYLYPQEYKGNIATIFMENEFILRFMLLIRKEKLSIMKQI
jgi:hypothetical protein